MRSYIPKRHMDQGLAVSKTDCISGHQEHVQSWYKWPTESPLCCTADLLLQGLLESNR